MSVQNRKRPNQEKEKQGPGYNKIPAQGRIKCKVFNQQNPGVDIEAGINGVTFQIKHGSVVDLHPSQIEVLQNAIIDTTEYIDVGNDKFKKRPIQIPRFMVQIMDMGRPKKTPEELKGTPAIISGRE
jgi:hypothetical protein